MSSQLYVVVETSRHHMGIISKIAPDGGRYRIRITDGTYVAHHLEKSWSAARAARNKIVKLWSRLYYGEETRTVQSH